jgi:hypothetical protein
MSVKSYSVWLIDHDGNQYKSTVLAAHPVNKGLGNFEAVINFLMRSWWGSPAEVAHQYQYVYVETPDGKQRSKLYSLNKLLTDKGKPNARD